MIKEKVANGFTIIELLVVIVVIGTISAIVLVSYSGVSEKATIASMQADLANSAQKLKMYYTDHNVYPQSLDSNYCPQNPEDAKYCLRVSGQNSYTYTSSSPYNTFSLTIRNNTVLNGYAITENSPITVLPPPVSAAGGTISQDGDYKTHTFTSNGTFSVSSGGIVHVIISGAGGGAGGPIYEDLCAYYGNGTPGGASIVSIGGTEWRANGGLGASGEVNYCNGSGINYGVDAAVGNTNSPPGWTTTNGGGSSGGSKYYWGSGDDWEQYGGNGGNGGKLEKDNLNVSAGDIYTVTVGSKGQPNGNPGIVVFKYINK